jgi:hypothetical protein
VAEADPEACFGTAVHVIKGHASGDSTGYGHDLELPVPKESWDVLWRAVPIGGSIGIHSPGACMRIYRFDGFYECNGGTPVYVGGPA